MENQEWSWKSHKSILSSPWEPCNLYTSSKKLCLFYFVQYMQNALNYKGGASCNSGVLGRDLAMYCPLQTIHFGPNLQT